MNTYQIECFLNLAKTLNYAKTAEIMHTSQPAITRQIQSLEKELNTQLFNRSKHHVELSEHGKSFITDAKRILQISNQAIQKFDSNKNTTTPLSIACAGLTHASILVDTLTQLKKMYPNLHPSLITVPVPHALKKIEEGTLDLAIAAKMPNSKVKNCVYKEITKTKITCIYNDSYPLNKKKDITLETLKQYPLILFHPVDISESILSYEIDTASYSSEVYYCDYPSEAILLAASGFGIAIMPEILIPKGIPLNKQDIKGIHEISYGIYHKPNVQSSLIHDFLVESRKLF